MTYSDLAGSDAAERAVWNPGPSVPVLISGNEDDVVVIAAMLCTLDPQTRGRVFLEVDTQDEVMHLPGPGRIVVTWLVRNTERRTAAPGELLELATSAWLTEMLPLDGVTDSRVYTWQSGRSEMLVC